MTETAGIRTTDLRVAGHRRLVVESLVYALRSVFDGGYDRDRQLVNLQVVSAYPLDKMDWPTIIVEYENTLVQNAGVGHEEWFNDAGNILRKWNHNRFEGTVNFTILAFTPLDRDIAADALVEILRFGRLDPAMHSFFDGIYGLESDTNVELRFTQLMLNTDIINGGGNSESIAPWNAEDVHVYETSHSVEIHGGYYNVIPQDTWGYVTAVDADSYPEGEIVVEMPFPDLTLPWLNPFVYLDIGGVTAESVISAGELEYHDANDYIDALVVRGTAEPAGVDTHP